MTRKRRLELRDSHHPTWRGQRFSSLEKALTELAQAIGEKDRWTLTDRDTGETIEKGPRQ